MCANETPDSWLVTCSVAVHKKMQINEPERPGMTPITLVAGGTTTYCLWIEQPSGPCARFTVRCDSDGNVFAAIGVGNDEEVCNDYTPE